MNHSRILRVFVLVLAGVLTAGAQEISNSRESPAPSA